MFVFCFEFLFSILCILCSCIVLCIVSPLSSPFPIFAQVYRPLPLSGNQIAANKYNFKSFHFTNCIYMFCVDLRTNSDYFPIQHYLTGLYNWDGVCLLRGTGVNVYIQFSLIFVSEVLGGHPSVTVHSFYSTIQCVSIILYTNGLFTNTTVTKTTSECFYRQELQKNQLDVSMQTFTSRVHNLLSWHKLYPGNIHMRVNTPA
jgi:hypothetical protein